MCNVKDKHIVKVVKFNTINHEHDYYEISERNNAYGGLDSLFKENRMTLLFNKEDLLSIALLFVDTHIEYEVDYTFDGEDEVPYETSREASTFNYIPISFCPICGKPIEIEIVNEIDLTKQEEELLEKIEELESLPLSRRGVKKTQLLYKYKETLNSIYGGHPYTYLEKKESTIDGVACYIEETF